MSYLSPSGERLGQLRHGLLDLGGGGERVRARALKDAQGHRHLLVEIAVAAVIGGAELDPGDVVDADHAAVGVGLDDDVAEGLGVGEAPLRLDVELKGAGLRHRRLVDDAGRHLHVLAAQRGDDVAGGQIAHGELLGIEPDAHRIVARAEDGDVADAVDARQHVLHMQASRSWRCRAGRACRRATADGSPSSGRATAWSPSRRSSAPPRADAAGRWRRGSAPAPAPYRGRCRA